MIFTNLSFNDFIFPDVTVEYRHGLSVFSVPLPSRKESCEIVLKPVSHTVKDFISFIKEEDKGIDRVAVYRDSKYLLMLMKVVTLCHRGHSTCFQSYILFPPGILISQS